MNRHEMRRDRRVGKPRKMFFGIGLNRTGTKSLTHAMDQLGFTTNHNPKRVEDIRQFEFVSDFPIIYLYKALDRYFGNTTKFILTTRDIESWLASWMRFGSILDEPRSPHKTFRYKIRLQRACHRFMTYGDIDFNEPVHRAAYHRHHADVLDHFRTQPERLLILDIAGGEGWEKLCPFVGVEVPDIPFPHQNRAKRTGTKRLLYPGEEL